MKTAPMSSADHYLDHQQCNGGVEPNGMWFNPAGLFELTDQGAVDNAGFFEICDGYSPLDGWALIALAGCPERSPGLDFTFSVDNSVSALWAIADAGTGAVIEAIVDEGARFAIEQTMVRWCSTTLVRRPGKNGEPDEIEVVPADLIGAQFQHGENSEGNPHLHVHFLIFNVAKAHEDGLMRTTHMDPMYEWEGAGAAAFGAYVAWEMGERLGVRFEHYGENNEYLRIAGMPASQSEGWSRLLKRWFK